MGLLSNGSGIGVGSRSRVMLSVLRIARCRQRAHILPRLSSLLRDMNYLVMSKGKAESRARSAGSNEIKQKTEREEVGY